MPLENLPPLGVERPDGAVKDATYIDFNGAASTAKYGYASGQRLQALAGDANTIYGKLEGGVVVRGEARWVGSEWLKKSDSLLTSAKAAIGAKGGTTINAGGVLIDDAELLGTSPTLRDVTDALEWEAGVTGALVAEILGSTVALRPDTMQRSGAVITFSESSAWAGTGGDKDVLTMQWSYAQSDASLQHRRTELQAPAALVMDELADGAWETGQPLWVRTDRGFLRWHTGVFDLSYSFHAESRNVDVTAWLPAGPSGSFARLLLDRSGAKVLKIDTGAKLATLIVMAPALLVTVPQACCDGRRLAAVELPPDDADVVGTLCVVTDAVCRAKDFCHAQLRVTQADGPHSATMDVSLTDPDDRSRYFAPDAQWVRPGESARNSRAGVSRARVLLPFKPAANFRLRWTRELQADGIGAVDLQGAMSFDTRGMGDGPALAAGPLAKFAVRSDGTGDFCEELWPAAPAPEVGSEPAVLRSIYRRSTAQGAADTPALPPYETTRVGQPEVIAETARRMQVEGDHVQWHAYRPGPGEGLRQGTRFVAGSNGTQRGWSDGVNFLGRPGAGSGPVDYLQLQGAGQHQHSWIRLSNDTLVQHDGIAAEPGLPQPTSAEFYDVVTSRMAPLSTSLGGNVPPEQAGTLPLFELVETLSPTGGPSAFVLTLQDRDRTIPIWTGPAAHQSIVNRLVISAANPHPDEISAGTGDECALLLKKLNRLYFELERDGPRFSVRRAMLGWTAHQAFGLNAAVNGLEVTELFESVQGALNRTVEFNGTLAVTAGSLQDGSHRYAMNAFFWTATWTRNETGPSTIRVICNHVWDFGGGELPFTSVQDARCIDGRLDLSADLLLLQSAAKLPTDELASDSRWQPSRRNLFTVVLDATRESIGKTSNEFVAFVKIRHAPGGLAMADDAARDVSIIPDWRATERDIVPTFSDVPRPARARRHTWLRGGADEPHRLGTPSAEPVSAELSVEFSRIATDLKTVASLASCTLVSELGLGRGIPRWIPSPVQRVRVSSGASAGTAPDPMRRLWLFDGPPRMVAEWLDQGDALKDAQLSLTRMGWTREAVLEKDPSGKPDEVQWETIDSPLLNREASIGWFGWPLAPLGDHGSRVAWPYDALPRTEELPQFRANTPRAFAVEASFDHDRDSRSGKHVWRIHPGDLSATPAGVVRVPAEFRSAGLRAGAWHRVVDYHGDSVTLTVQAPTALPPPRFHELQRPQPGALVWERSDAEDERITEGEGNDAGRRAFNVKLPLKCSGVRFLDPDVGLRVQDARKVWDDVDANRVYAPLQDGDARGLGISAEPGRPLKALRLEIYTDEKVSGQEHFFPAGQERLVGVFSPDGTLEAFGTEEVTFRPNDQGSAGSIVRWSRSAEWQRFARAGVDQEELAHWYVVAVDIEGRLSIYR
ncbi:hypothetical protein [Pseudorhodoferax sp.]|uniref:hypothetical protein n=1 Tax=Pseudorhodoferax sp. TaxID=1993553 RepID=UPI002DD64F27|nr:hypothetical protein [Pseudorhodoferax sp.]